MVRPVDVGEPREERSAQLHSHHRVRRLRILNRLAAETSPYLLQHAGNPVDWYPWGEEAFSRARSEDKPVMLSIGYSSCHWCHVMAHESFEDPEVAAFVNDRFVSVKVDREERPDIDAIYMSAVQATTGSGGWPMTLFLTPGGKPFFAGTYFPPRDTHGLPAFLRVLEAVDQSWRQRRGEIEEQASAIARAVAAGTGVQSGTHLLPRRSAVDLESAHRLLDRAVDHLAALFDSDHGGFGNQPKFPQPELLELCLVANHVHGNRRALEMATSTLKAMAAGGIYDQLGGGFHRYSTDANWTVPHFEKMLYDQAGLVASYIHAWLVTGDAAYRIVASETIEYVLDDLGGPEGGLFSARDADTPAGEGAFYLWTPGEVEAVLGKQRASIFAEFYEVTEEGNFEGRNVLRSMAGLRGDLPAEIEESRIALKQARSLRPQPGLDDKVITEWNAMFCSALAAAAAATGRANWMARAVDMGEFLLSAPRRVSDRRWLRTWRHRREGPAAFAADHAWLVEAFTRLSELTGLPSWLDHAAEAAQALLDLFVETGSGVVHTTARDAEPLFVRPVERMDGALPSAAAVSAGALCRLASLSGEPSYLESAEHILAAALQASAGRPLSSARLLPDALLIAGGPSEVVVAGDRPDLLRAFRSRYEPFSVSAWGTPGRSPLWLGREPGFAYVCHHGTCSLPAATVTELEQRLDDASSVYQRE